MKNLTILKLEYIFVFIYILFHIFFINLDPINDEYIFYSGADFIRTQNIEIINIFFEYNANTLGFSYLIFIFSTIFNTDNFYLIGKIISLSSYIFLYFGILNFIQIFEIKKKFEILIIIFLCPIVFTYGFRATPDLFSFCLAFFSFSLILIKKKIIIKLLAFFLLSIAFVIKPINGIALFFVFLYYFLFNKKKIFQLENIIGSILFFLISTTFFYLNYKNHGFAIISPNWGNLDTSENNFLINFIYYLGFLNLVIIPFNFKIILKEILNLKNFVLFTLISLTIFSYQFIHISESINEINFGFLSDGLNEYILKLFFGLNAWFFIFFFFISISTKNRNHTLYFILITTLTYLLIISNFSPAQRYLMILFPTIYLLALRKNYNKIIFIIVLLAYFILNLLILNNHLVISDLSKKTHNFLIKEDLLNQTHPGYLGQHSLSRFAKFYDSKMNIISQNNIFDPTKKYIITNEINNHENVIFSYSSNKFLINKEIYVVLRN